MLWCFLMHHMHMMHQKHDANTVISHSVWKVISLITCNNKHASICSLLNWFDQSLCLYYTRHKDIRRLANTHLLRFKTPTHTAVNNRWLCGEKWSLILNSRWWRGLNIFSRMRDVEIIYDIYIKPHFTCFPHFNQGMIWDVNFLQSNLTH